MTGIKTNAQLRGAPRDVSKNVKIKITQKGCFMVPNPAKPNELKEMEVGSVHEVSIGRANGMKGKCNIIGNPTKA